MIVIENKAFEGERPLYKTVDATIKNVSIGTGESSIKESRNLNVLDCEFNGKYPFWHNNEVVIEDSYFSEGARAAIWYTSNVVMKNCTVDSPKIFRDAEIIKISNTKMDTDETLWDCKDITIEDSSFKGNNLLLHSSNLKVSGFTLDGNYSFQHVKNGEFRNCNIRSKDAFWNTEDITVYDSVIEGEYLGWYSKNLKFVNCKIIGTQPLCYANDLVLENCEMINTDLSFEYSTVNADVKGTIDSVKNPKSGVIKASAIKELITDDMDKTKVQIILETV